MLTPLLHSIDAKDRYISSFAAAPLRIGCFGREMALSRESQLWIVCTVSSMAGNFSETVQKIRLQGLPGVLVASQDTLLSQPVLGILQLTSQPAPSSGSRMTRP